MTCCYHFFIDDHINRTAIGVYDAKSPQGSNWVVVRIIPESLPDDIQYFSLEKVLFQHCEIDCDLQTVDAQDVVW